MVNVTSSLLPFSISVVCGRPGCLHTLPTATAVYIVCRQGQGGGGIDRWLELWCWTNFWRNGVDRECPFLCCLLSYLILFLWFHALNSRLTCAKGMTHVRLSRVFLTTISWCMYGPVCGVRRAFASPAGGFILFGTNLLSLWLFFLFCLVVLWGNMGRRCGYRV